MNYPTTNTPFYRVHIQLKEMLTQFSPVLYDYVLELLEWWQCFHNSICLQQVHPHFIDKKLLLLYNNIEHEYTVHTLLCVRVCL